MARYFEPFFFFFLYIVFALEFFTPTLCMENLENHFYSLAYFTT